jgi:hypothetical protein
LFLVLSNVANEAAQHLVEMFPPGAASLVTASDLHRSFKAAVRLADFSGAALTIGGVKTSPREIRGVVSSIAYFLPQEFYYVEPADRDYVCAETSAFFIYFLSQLGCPKLNPPMTKTLCGSGMHRIEWMRAARDLGVPLQPVRLQDGRALYDDAANPRPRVRATCIGGAIVEGGVPDLVRERTFTLSRAFAMPYLSADFTSSADGEYLLAELWSVPDLRVPANREAIVRFMQMAP